MAELLVAVLTATLACVAVIVAVKVAALSRENEALRSRVYLVGVDEDGPAGTQPLVRRMVYMDDAMNITSPSLGAFVSRHPMRLVIQVSGPQR